MKQRQKGKPSQCGVAKKKVGKKIRLRKNNLFNGISKTFSGSPQAATSFCCKMQIQIAAKHEFILRQNAGSILRQNKVASCSKTKTHFAAK